MSSSGCHAPDGPRLSLVVITESPFGHKEGSSRVVRGFSSSAQRSSVLEPRRLVEGNAGFGDRVTSRRKRALGDFNQVAGEVPPSNWSLRSRAEESWCSCAVAGARPVLSLGRDGGRCVARTAACAAGPYRPGVPRQPRRVLSLDPNRLEATPEARAEMKKTVDLRPLQWIQNGAEPIRASTVGYWVAVADRNRCSESSSVA